MAKSIGTTDHGSTDSVDGGVASNEIAIGEPNGIDPASIADAPVVKRGPGRPRKDGSDSNSGTGGIAGSNSKSKRKGNNSLSDNVASLSGILLILHLGIATRFDVPELILEDDDANALSNAIIPVLDQFDVKIDPKFAAIAGLVMVSAQVYGPKLVLIKMRKDEQREKNANATTL